MRKIWQRIKCMLTFITKEALPSGLPKEVQREEDLARFLTSSRHFSSTAVKPAAFLPNQQGQTSVFRHGQEPVEALWSLADEHLGSARSLHGAAILKASAIRAALLQIVPEEPPPRHANIVGWPTDGDPALAKAKQKESALLLVRHAFLVRR